MKPPSRATVALACTVIGYAHVGFGLGLLLAANWLALVVWSMGGLWFLNAHVWGEKP